MQMEVEEKVIDVLAKLQTQAAARLMPFYAYLEQFVEDEPASLNSNITLEEFDEVLDELAARPPSVTSLPANFSRTDIYADHN